MTRISDLTILNQGKSSHLIQNMNYVQPARSYNYKYIKSHVLPKKFRRVFFLPEVHPSLKFVGSNFKDAIQNGTRPLTETSCNVLEDIWCVGLD